MWGGGGQSTDFPVKPGVKASCDVGSEQTEKEETCKNLLNQTKIGEKMTKT
jgi:hypothetical protein